MIYDSLLPHDPIDQGDLVDACPVAVVTEFQPDAAETAKVQLDLHRVIVLTQTCDLAQQKGDSAIVASVFDAQHLIDHKVLKAADVKGPIRAGRVWGLYFLPARSELGIAEMIVDFRRLQTVRLEILHALCHAGRRRGRLRSPYREHLAKHFADTFSRIGLPQPYDTV
jgi:hypothetical protein